MFDGAVNISNETPSEYFHTIINEEVDFIDPYFSQSTGLIEGGVISISGLKTINISNGVGQKINYSDPENIIKSKVSFGPFIGVESTVSAFAVWVAINIDGINPIVEFFTDLTPVLSRSRIVIGRIWSTVGDVQTQITNFGYYRIPSYGIENSARDLILALKSFSLTGNKISTSVGLQIAKSGGTSFRYWINTAPSDNIGYENVHIDSALNPITSIGYHLQGVKVLQYSTQLEPNFYDNNGVLGNVPLGSWTIQEIWFYPVSNVVSALFGQVVYPTKPKAILGLSSEKKVRNEDVLFGAILRAYILVQSGSVSIDSNLIFHEYDINQPSFSTGITKQYLTTSFAFTEYGIADTNYTGGFYRSSATSQTLAPLGDFSFGTANIMIGGYAFLVSGGPTVGAGVITIHGTSITEEGVRTANDSEIIVPNTSQASLNSYFQTTKRWLGRITYRYSINLIENYSFNYGFCSYETLNGRQMTITDINCTGKSSTVATNINIELLAHRFTGWVYSAGAFIPQSSVICSSLTDYNTETSFGNEDYFFYSRNNLNTVLNGANREGFLFRVTIVTNDALRYGTFKIGMII